MVVRGAPAIGITAAYGMAIAQKVGEDMSKAYNTLATSRPTAVNLLWALDRVSWISLEDLLINLFADKVC